MNGFVMRIIITIIKRNTISVLLQMKDNYSLSSGPCSVMIIAYSLKSFVDLCCE